MGHPLISDLLSEAFKHKDEFQARHVAAMIWGLGKLGPNVKNVPFGNYRGNNLINVLLMRSIQVNT